MTNENLHILYCSECGLIMSSISTEAARVVDGSEMLCRNCMEKRYGKAYMDNIENNVEEVDIDDLDDEQEGDEPYFTL